MRSQVYVVTDIVLTIFGCSCTHLPDIHACFCVCTYCHVHACTHTHTFEIFLAFMTGLQAS